MPYVNNFSASVGPVVNGTSERTVNFSWTIGPLLSDVVIIDIVSAANPTGAAVVPPTVMVVNSTSDPVHHKLLVKPGAYTALLRPRMMTDGEVDLDVKLKDEFGELQYPESFDEVTAFFVPAPPEIQSSRPVPQIVGVAITASGTVEVTWSSPATYNYFNIRYSLNGSEELQIEVETSGTHGKYSLFPLRDGDHLVFKVQGCDRGLINSKCSPWCNPVAFTVPDGSGYRGPLMPPKTRIAALSRNPSQMSIFGVSEDRTVWEGIWDRQWRFWIPVSTQRFPHATPVAALSRNPDQMDVFAVDHDGRVLSDWWNGPPWRQWFWLEDLLFIAGSSISALSRSPDFVDVFLVGKDGAVYGNWWNGNPWRGWFRIGSPQFTQGSRIGAVSRSPDFMDLFCAANDGTVRHCNWNGSWGDWSVVPGLTVPPGTPLTALRNDDDHLSIYAVGSDGKAWYNLSNGGWQGWRTIGTQDFPLMTEISGFATDAKAIDLAALGSDGRVWHVAGNGQQGHGGWSEWTAREGNILFPPGTPVTVHKHAPFAVDLFAVGTDGNVMNNRKERDQWSGWKQINI